MGDNDKMYQTPSTLYPNLNAAYSGPPCTKQLLEPPNQQFYPYSINMAPLNNSYNQPNNYYETYNTQKTQANLCMYSQEPPWDTRLEETLKIGDKIDLIEINSKDLSPASYCSNLDVITPDFYKNFGYFNKIETPSWGSISKTGEFSSCAQSSFPATGADKTVKYCSIQTMQKSQEFDYNLTFSNNEAFNEPICSLPQNEFNLGYSCFETGKLAENASFFDNFNILEQQTEGSNEESDIIVEESDEDGYNEFEAKKQPSDANRCTICNVAYTTMGAQFYFLNLQIPLTMSSQRPVYRKISELLGRIPGRNNYICSACLGLVNTIDHLQLKLSTFRLELEKKFRKTCVENEFARARVRKRLINAEIRCKKCRKVLSLRNLAVRHAIRHKIAGVLCEICGFLCANGKRYRRHKIKAHGVKIAKMAAFRCANCSRAFRTRSNLTEHANYCLGLMPFQCQQCDKKFPTSTKRKNHVKLKHEKKFKAICSICNIGFVKQSDYRSHKVSHSTDKKFECGKCDKTYKTLSNLNFHMKQHNEKLPFGCSVCGKGFMRKEYLEAHVNNHNGVKNFACGLCEKRFVSQKNLDSHLKYHDGGGAKRKTCDVCGKTMTTGFEEHLRIHNNLKEFECDRCDNRFNTKGTLAKHKKRKHSNASNELKTS